MVNNTGMLGSVVYIQDGDLRMAPEIDSMQAYDGKQRGRGHWRGVNIPPHIAIVLRSDSSLGSSRGTVNFSSFSRQRGHGNKK